MCSEQVVRQLHTLAADSRYALDLQNILAAVELCGLGFGRGLELTEDLNTLLSAEWPTDTQKPLHEC
jgi:hypothetical protein